MRNRLLFVFVSSLLVVPLLSGGLVGARPSDEEDDPYKFLTVFTEVLRLVRTVYVEEPDLESLMAGAMDGTADALDPFSFYVPAGRAEAFGDAERESRRQSGLMVLKERGVAFAVAVDPGGAAERAGIERNDILSKIAQRSTRDLPMWEIHEVLAGRRGNRVEVEVVRQGAPEEVVIELSPGSLPEPSLSEHHGVPVLRLPAFEDDTRERVAAALDEVASRPLLIDLRGTAGGDPRAAYRVAGLFAAGKQGELRKRDETLEEYSSEEPPVFGNGLGLLVDRGSQGAAEIFASVLNQGANGVLFGEPTFGHAGRSHRIVLDSGAFLQLTDAFYTGPDLEPLDDSLTPDVPIRRFRFRGDDEEGDEVLEKAVESFRERVGVEKEAA